MQIKSLPVFTAFYNNFPGVIRIADTHGRGYHRRVVLSPFPVALPVKHRSFSDDIRHGSERGRLFPAYTVPHRVFDAFKVKAHVSRLRASHRPPEHLVIPCRNFFRQRHSILLKFFSGQRHYRLPEYCFITGFCRRPVPKTGLEKRTSRAHIAVQFPGRFHYLGIIRPSFGQIVAVEAVGKLSEQPISFCGIFAITPSPASCGRHGCQDRSGTCAWRPGH